MTMYFPEGPLPCSISWEERFDKDGKMTEIVSQGMGAKEAKGVIDELNKKIGSPVFSIVTSRSQKLPTGEFASRVYINKTHFNDLDPSVADFGCDDRIKGLYKFIHPEFVPHAKEETHSSSGPEVRRGLMMPATPISTALETVRAKFDINDEKSQLRLNQLFTKFLRNELLPECMDRLSPFALLIKNICLKKESLPWGELAFKLDDTGGCEVSFSSTYVGNISLLPRPEFFTKEQLDVMVGVLDDPSLTDF